MQQIYILLAILWTLPMAIHAQVDLLQKDWRDHLSYSRAYLLEEAGDWIFATAQAGMLSYNESTGDLRKHSKATGLSDVNITALAYAPQANYLVVGYANGNIDLLREGDPVINLSDIKRKILTADKNIHAIYIKGTTAYLACGFGIVVLNLENQEVMETYYLGENGAFIEVYDVTVFNNALYAATELGVYTASLNSPNLLDYSYWSTLSYIPQSSAPYRMAEVFNNTLYLVYEDQATGADRIITATETSYASWNQTYDALLYSLHACNGFLAVNSYRDVDFYNANGQPVYSYDIVHQRDGLISASGQVYVASHYTGFMHLNAGGNVTYLAKTGPRDNEVSKVFTYEDRVWVTSGSISDRFSNGMTYGYTDGLWSSLNGNDLFTYETQNTNSFKLAINPAYPDELYIGSHFSGVTHWNGNSATHLVNMNLSLFSDVSDVKGLRVSGMEFDSKGNLWFVVSLINRPLCRIDPEGNLTRYAISNNVFNRDDVTFTDLLITENDHIWLSTINHGIVVLHIEDEENFEQVLFQATNQDGKLLNLVYCLEEDLSDNVWVGTNLGPVIYYSASDIFTRESISGIQPTYARNDGTDNIDYLLFAEAIQDIECDGGNRKWIATGNSGAYLVSDDGKQTLLNFHVDNSPMLDNTVTGIGVQEQTGEVFFATTKGLVSYGGAATKGNSNYANAYVYPNPVRPEYEGPITVTGLVENTLVKITDISGNLVWEMNSLGGQATWDGRNFQGDRVASGIYLFMLATEDGSQSHIVKLLLMH